MGQQNCILLRGVPGMGKTTLIKHLAYTVAHDECPKSLRGYLAVPIFLKDFWPIYRDALNSSEKKINFESLLKSYLENSRCPLTLEIITDYLKKNKVLIMLDGLDEVPENLLGPMIDIIAEFQFAHNRNRFLLTSIRPFREFHCFLLFSDRLPGKVFTRNI